MNTYPFIYTSSGTHPFPLEAYLPVYRPGLVKVWLEDLSPPDGLILTPFSGSPQVILEAARAGFRMLVPAHNPVFRFLIEGFAQPAPRDRLNTALVRLASSTKSGQRIKPLILSLYETDCPQCGGPASASSFIWSRDTGEPALKICRCSTCGEDTRGEVNAADIARANKFQENSPSHARALTRVSAPDDPIRIQVEIALRSYPSRSVYALFTLFNKISGLALARDEKKYLEMLLLQAFYRSSSPETRLLSEQEGESDHDDYYEEENVWYILEDALDIWASENPQTPLVYWPELPPTTGGICIFPGRIRELIPLISEKSINAVLLTFPKPRLSFWALSALWTGWLWGQDAAAPLRSILSTRKFDWNWITRAVGITLAELKQHLPKDIPYLGYLPGLKTEYMIASLSAAGLAGLGLDYLTLEPDLKYGLTAWRSDIPGSTHESEKNDREIIREAGIDLLRSAGEPEHTLSLYGAGLVGVIRNKSLQRIETPKDLEVDVPILVKDFEENIAYRQGFLFYSRIEKWWHQDLLLSPDPRSDQVEKALVNLLVRSTDSLPEKEIFQQIYQTFPGLDTPSEGYLRALLVSYGDKIVQDPPEWRLKPTDQPTMRKNDLKEIETILTRLGQKLGFTVDVDNPTGNAVHLSWSTELATHYNFFISASGLLNKIIAEYKKPPKNSWIVLPGSRAGLIYYKIHQNPVLDKAIKDNYGLVKFRHLRRVEEGGGLTHANILEQLALDPFTSESPQLPLI